MADQDDDESALSAFAQGVKNGLTKTVTNAVSGAKRIAEPFGLAPGPGGDNANFPADNNRTD